MKAPQRPSPNEVKVETHPIRGANKSPQAGLWGIIHIPPRFAPRLPTPQQSIAPHRKEAASPRQIRTGSNLVGIGNADLCRRVIVLEQESTPRECRGRNEVTLQDQSTSAEKVRKNEGHGGKCRRNSNRAKKDLQVNREQIITDYEGRLEENDGCRAFNSRRTGYRIEQHDKARQH
jgi:hypothetical protein